MYLRRKGLEQRRIAAAAGKQDVVAPQAGRDDVHPRLHCGDDGDGRHAAVAALPHRRY